MSQALYRKWRPRLWDRVIGQEHVVRTLQNAIRSQRVGHAYLFAGPRGTGKTTTARLLAKAVNCLSSDSATRPCDACDYCKAVNEGRFLDLIEIDAASNTSVDDVRDLRDKINFAPSQGQFKVYIIDEVHMLSTAAFNALLKTLEEPPAHAIFILATTEVHKIPATVLSRCQRHEFRRIPVNDIVAHLREIAHQESLNVEEEALLLIARQSTGSMRDAISLLDQLASSGEKITLEMAQIVLGTATNQSVVVLVGAALARDAAEGLRCIYQALDSGSDPRQFARQIVDYLRGLLLIRMGNAGQIDATQEMRAQMAHHAGAFTNARLVKAIELFNNAAVDRRGSWQPGLLLELALAGLVEEEEEEKPALLSAQDISHVSSPPVSQTPVRKRESSSVPPAAPPPGAPLAAPSDAPSGASQGSANLALQDIIQNWDRIKALAKKYRPTTFGLLNSCKPLRLNDAELLLGFASDIVKSKMEAGENIDLTRRSIAYLLGVDVHIHCVVMGNKAGVLPPGMEAEGDGMVGEALNLGGQIKKLEKPARE